MAKFYRQDACRVTIKLILKTFIDPLLKSGGHKVFVLSVILTICNSVVNLSLAYNFLTASARGLIFKGTNIFVSITLTLEFDLFVENFILANNF